MKNSNNTPSLDTMIAQLNIITTDFIFSKHPCRHRTITIAKTLHEICLHKELAFFPEQQQVYLKMLKVWKALAYDMSMAEQSDHNKQVKAEELKMNVVH